MPTTERVLYIAGGTYEDEMAITRDLYIERRENRSVLRVSIGIGASVYDSSLSLYLA